MHEAEEASAGKSGSEGAWDNADRDGDMAVLESQVANPEDSEADADEFASLEDAEEEFREIEDEVSPLHSLHRVEVSAGDGPSGSDDKGEEVTAREEDEEGDEHDEHSNEHSSQGSADVEGSEEERQEDCSGSEHSYEGEEENDVSEADVPPDASKAGSLHNKECDGAQEVGSAKGRQNNADDIEIAIHELETTGGSQQDKAVDEAAGDGEAACVDGDAGEHVPEAEDEAADDAAEADQSRSGASKDDSQIPLHEAEDADPEGDTPGGAKQGKAVDEAAEDGEAACVDGDAGEHVPDAEDEAADDAAEADQSGSGALKDDSPIPLHEAEDADPEGDTPGGAQQRKALDEAADAGEAACVDGDVGENVPEAEDGSADDASEADESGSGVTLHAGGSKEGEAADEAADAGGAACVDSDARKDVPETLVSHVGQSPAPVQTE